MMNIEDKFTGEIVSIETPPTRADNNANVIAFVPEQGFQSCQYYNGSKSWMSIVTKLRVYPTHWIKMTSIFSKKDGIQFRDNGNTL